MKDEGLLFEDDEEEKLGKDDFLDNPEGNENEALLGEDPSEEPVEFEKTGDLVQAYFHSMGDISILTKDEETELAKRLEEGKNIIRDIVVAMPLYKRIEEEIVQGQEPRRAMEKVEEEAEESEEKEKPDEALIRSLEILDERMREIESADTKKIEAELGLGIDELKEKWDRITRARVLVMEAKNEFITRNLRLVVNIAKNFVGKGLPLLDLIQEGNIGLMKAVDKFKHEKGFKFSTYATCWIRQAIARASEDQTKTIRVPVHMMELYNRAARISNEMLQSLGRWPNKDELAEKLGVPTKKIEEIFRVVQDPLAFQDPIGDDESELGDFIKDENGQSPQLETDKKQVRDRIAEVLATLTPQEEKVIRLRFGMGVDKDHTLEEVGKKMNRTRERIRQIEVKALGKLHHPSRMRLLKEITGHSDRDIQDRAIKSLRQ